MAVKRWRAIFLLKICTRPDATNRKSWRKESDLGPASHRIGNIWRDTTVAKTDLWNADVALHFPLALPHRL